MPSFPYVSDAQIDFTLASNAGAGNGAAVSWSGGPGIFTAEATWGGGSAKLQQQTLNGTWVDVPSVTLSANGSVAFDLPAGTLIRAVIATATACYAYARRARVGAF